MDSSQSPAFLIGAPDYRPRSSQTHRSPAASPLPDAESFHKSSHVAKPTDTVRAASFKCVLLAPRSRCLSAPPRAPTIFLASRSFAILSLAALRSFLSPPSLSCPTRNRLIVYFRLTAAATRCTFTVPGLSPFEPDTPAPITPFILTLILITSAQFSTHPAALLLSGYTSRSPLRWSWLELAAALLARQSHGWRGGGSAQRSR